MASIDDVKVAFGQAAAAALTGAGITAEIYTGWPDAEDIDNAVAKNYLLTSVYEMNDGADVPRLPQTGDYSIPASTLTAEVVNNTVTFAGLGNPGGNVGVSLNGVQHAFATPFGTETPAAIAAEFAAVIPGATAAGGVLTVPSLPNLYALVGVGGVSRTIIGWVRQSVMTTIWAPNATIRGAASAAIEQYLRAAKRLPLQDGNTATLFYHSTPTYDRSSAGDAYRRDVIFSAEFPVSADLTCPQIIFTPGNVTPSYLPAT